MCNAIKRDRFFSGIENYRNLKNYKNYFSNRNLKMSPLSFKLYLRYHYTKIISIKRWSDLKIFYWNTLLGHYDVFLTSYYLRNTFKRAAMGRLSISKQKKEVFLESGSYLIKKPVLKKKVSLTHGPKLFWFWFMIERFLTYKISGISNYFKRNININVSLVMNSYENAIFVLSDIVMALRYRVPVRKVMRHMSIKLMRENSLLGYKLAFSGRYSRQQRTKIFWKFDNMRGLGKIYALVDYASGFAKLKYGICGVKLWLMRARLNTNEEKMLYYVEEPLSYKIPMKVDFNVYFAGF